MFDLKWIRDNPEAFDRGLARRGLPPVSADDPRAWTAAGAQRRPGREELQAERNRLAKEIGAAKAKGGDAAPLHAQVADEQGAAGGARSRARRSCSARSTRLLAALPNLPADDVPDGTDETGNVARPPARHAAALRLSGRRSMSSSARRCG